MKFKIGTLDQLMKLNDALARVDANLEAVTRKIEKQGLELDPSFEFQALTRDGNSKPLTQSTPRSSSRPSSGTTSSGSAPTRSSSWCTT